MKYAPGPLLTCLLVSLGLILVSIPTARAQAVTSPRVVTVSPDGTGANFSNLRNAIDSITTASASNPYVILVYPGIYTGSLNSGLPWKSYVSLRGVDRYSTIIRGSQVAQFFTIPLINATMTQGVEISNITMDGSQQFLDTLQYQSGATGVCGAHVTFTDVTYVTVDPNFTINSGNDYSGPNCTTAGSVIVRNCDLGTVADQGGDWLITNSWIHTTVSNPGDPGYGFVRTGSGSFPGTTTIIGSVLESTGATANVGDIYPLLVTGFVPGEARIVNSVIHARSTSSAPNYDVAPVWPVGSGGPFVIEESTLIYESVSGATSGQFYGINAESLTLYPVVLRNSVIRSIGSGGTRADVRRESDGAPVTLAGVQYSTVTGSGTSGITTLDFRQGQYSADLTIPLSNPTANANGRLFIGSSDRLCYRSGGEQRCVGGGLFMKVSKVGTSSAPGNLVCVTAGSKRQGRAAVTIVSRDSSANVVGATVTGNWSGATTQNGVTAVTDGTGTATFTSNQANPGSVFTFTVTGVTLSPNFYDPASNLETTDSTPTCN